MPRLPVYLRRFVARRRRRFVAPQRLDGRRFGVGNYSGRRNAGGYRARRPGMGRFRGQNFPSRRSGPATGVATQPTPAAPVAPHAPAVSERPLNGSAPAAPPPAFWCSEHGWVICPMHGDGSAAGGDAVGQSPTSVFEFGSTSAAPGDVRTVTPRLPSPTPAVVGIEGDALGYVSAPTGASIFTMGSGARTLTSAPAAPLSPPRADADEPRLPSPTPATPPHSPRAGARRRLLALGLSLASPSADSPTSSRGRRAGTWSPAGLGLANGASNGVAPGTRLPGGSSDEDERGGSAARRR